MKANKKKKGFTLVELLAVIVILGILTTVVVVVFRNNDDSAKQAYYDKEEGLVVIAGKDYFSDNRVELPKDVGEISKVSLNQLISGNFIEEVMDYKKQACDYNDSYVYAQKIDEGNYSYWVKLSCSKNNYKTKEDTEAPTIVISPDIAVTNQTIQGTIEVKDNVKVSSLRYTILDPNGNTVAASNGFETYNGAVNFTLTGEGVYRIDASAYDSSGNLTNKTQSYEIDKTAPNCGTLKVDADASLKTWTKNDVRVTLSLPDDIKKVESFYSINGNEKVIGQELSFSLMDTGKNILRLVGYDAAGNSCEASVDGYYIDKKGPVINIHNGYVTIKDDENFSFTGNVTVTDADSGVSSTKIYVNNVERNSSSGLAVGTYRVVYKATDNVGNTSESSFTLEVLQSDREGPVYISKNGSMGSNSIPTANWEDLGSGVKERYYYVSTVNSVPSANSAGWKTYNNISYSAGCGTTYYLFVKAVDNKDNVTVYRSYIDSYYTSCYYGGGGGSSSSDRDDDRGSSHSSSSSSSSKDTCDWKCQMSENATAWHECTSKSCQDSLHKENEKIANQHKNEVDGFNSNNGVWSDKNGNQINKVNGGKTGSTSKSSGSSSSSSKKSSSTSSVSKVIKDTISKIFGKK